MASYHYPPSSADVDVKFLAPSASFKKQAGRAAGSVVLFFIVYLLLVLAAAALAAGCFYVGAMLIINLPKFFTIMIWLGMMALGVSVVFFLFQKMKIPQELKLKKMSSRSYFHSSGH